jgi:hypothetical protein
MDLSLILSRRYNAEWTLDGDDYEGLTWLSDSKKPTKAELIAKWESVQAEVEAEKVAKANKRIEILERLGITEAEAKLLLA